MKRMADFIGLGRAVTGVAAEKIGWAGRVSNVSSQRSSVIPKEPSEAPSPETQPGTGRDQDVFYLRQARFTPAFSSLPRVKVPETSNQTDDGGSFEMNADVFYSPKARAYSSKTIPRTSAAPDVDAHAKRDADVLHDASPEETQQSADNQPSEQIPSASAPAPEDATPLTTGRDQDHFYQKSSTQTDPQRHPPRPKSKRS